MKTKKTVSLLIILFLFQFACSILSAPEDSQPLSETRIPTDNLTEPTAVESFDGFGFEEVQRYKFDSSVEGVVWISDGTQLAVWTSTEQLYIIDFKKKSLELFLDYSEQLDALVNALVEVANKKCDELMETFKDSGFERSQICSSEFVNLENSDLREKIVGGKLYHTFVKHEEDAQEILKLSADGSRLAIAAVTGYKILDIPSRKIIEEDVIPLLDDENSFEYSIRLANHPDAISPKLNLFYNAGFFYKMNGEIDTEFNTFSQNFYGVNHVAFSPDGNYLFASEDESLTVWDLATFELVQSTSDVCYSSTGAFTADQHFVLTNCGPDIFLWDIETGQKESLGDGGYLTRRMTISPNGKTVLDADHVMDHSGTAPIFIKNVKVPEQDYYSFIPFDEDELITSLVFSPDSDFFAVGYTDGSMLIFEIHADLMQ